MKKTLTTAITVLVLISFLCTGALAQGNTAPGGAQPQGGSQPQGGGQMGNGQDPNGGGMQGGPMGGMNLDAEATAAAIATLTDTDTAAALTELLEAYQTAAAGSDETAKTDALKALQDALAAAGLQVQNGINGGSMNGTLYGRFLDADKFAETIAALTDDSAKANLTALLTAYQEAVSNQDQASIQETLRALFSAMTQPQTQPQAQPQAQATSQPQNGFDGQGMNADSYKYLDTEAVAQVIAALADNAAATSLSALLETYSTAVAGGDVRAIQDAFTALMDALTETGV